ncbi:MAG: hypothetical protein ACFB2X_01565 [Rivularia sp. (in: cyanobacteria)]
MVLDTRNSVFREAGFFNGRIINDQLSCINNQPTTKNQQLTNINLQPSKK